MPPWHSQTNGHPGIRPVTRELSRMLKRGLGYLGQSPCSRNARPQKALVGRAQLGSSQPPLNKVIVCYGLARDKARPWVKRLSWQTQGGWERKLRVVEDHSASIPEEITSERGAAM